MASTLGAFFCTFIIAPIPTTHSLMRSPARSVSFFSNIFLVAALAGMWFAFAPTKIGGGASYVIVQGNSMEPRFSRGDLVIIRKATDYSVGDIVTYWDNTLPAHVIHRIVGIEQDRFLLKGDNNGWIDITRPAFSDIVGKLWLHIPRLGKQIEWMRVPLHFAFIIALFGGILMATLFSKPRNTQGKTTTSAAPHYLEAGLYIAGAIFLIFFGLSVYAFSKPAFVPASATLYQQEGHFSYTAASIPGIYDEATIRSGEPIFPSHTCLMNVNFSYYLSNAQLQGITGSHQMYARVSDEKSGWQRTIPMNQKNPFSGNSFASTGTIDICQIELLVASLEEQTGLKNSNYKLEIIAPVLISGSVSGKNITDFFSPVLAFRFDKVHVYLESSDKSDAAFTFTKIGENNGVISEQANYVNIFRLEVDLQSMRILAATGLLFSLGTLAIIATYIYLIAQEDPEFLLRLKYSSLLVDVQGTTFKPLLPVVDVDSIETLAKLAERHGTMILHVAHPMLHDYLVQISQSTYRYSLNRSGRPPVEAPSSEKQIFSYPTTPQQNAYPQQPVATPQQEPNNPKKGYW